MTSAQRHNARQDRIWEACMQARHIHPGDNPAHCKICNPVRHTPAPWAYESVQTSDPAYKYAISRNGKGWWLALVTTGQEKEEGEANARLISSAPDLLIALKGARTALRKALPYLPADDDSIYAGEWLDEINAAIAQAEGK